MTDTLSTTPDTVSLTLELPRDIVERLHALEERATGTISDLLNETIAQRVAYLEWKFAKVQEAIDYLDAGGRRYSDEAVKAWIETLGTPNERPLPE
jgi:predicted transcriptional regulator